MKHNVPFEFQIGDKVLIREIGRPGRVVALLVDAEGVTYRVTYWESAKRESAFVPAEELQLLSDALKQSDDENQRTIGLA